MRGIEAAAGGVLSARSNSKTKNATKTLIPVQQWQCSKSFFYLLFTKKVA